MLGILLDPLFRSYLPATGVIWICGVKRPLLGAPENPAVGCLIENKRKFSSTVSASVDQFRVGSIIPDDRAIRGVIRAKKRWKYPPALPSGTPLQIYGGPPKVVLYMTGNSFSQNPHFQCAFITDSWLSVWSLFDKFGCSFRWGTPTS